MYWQRYAIRIFALLVVLLSLAYGQQFERILDSPTVTAETGTFGCSWGDFDNDDDLDLATINGVFIPKETFLYRNEGADQNYTFSGIFEGTITSDEHNAWFGSWIDYDSDGFLDLFLADQPTNALYRSLWDGSFEKIAGQELVEDVAIAVKSAVISRI